MPPNSGSHNKRLRFAQPAPPFLSRRSPDPCSAPAERRVALRSRTPEEPRACPPCGVAGEAAPPRRWCSTPARWAASHGRDIRPTRRESLRSQGPFDPRVPGTPGGFRCGPKTNRPQWVFGRVPDAEPGGPSEVWVLLAAGVTGELYSAYRHSLDHPEAVPGKRVGSVSLFWKSRA